MPYRRAPKFASGSVDSADNVLVRVHTDAGLIGQAEAQPRPYTYGETQTSIVDAVSGPLKDALTGVDPLRIELVADRCARVEGNRVARGAVDLAVWDLIGQILGCPCHTLLGGFADGVAAAHMVSFDEPAAMADEAIAISDQLGVGTFKVKVGRDPASMSQPSARSATPCRTPICTSTRTGAGATRTRHGPATSWPSSGCGRSRSRSRSRTGPAGCASPTAGVVPLVGDESCISLAHVDRALEEGAVRMVSVKTARTGFTNRAGSSTCAWLATSRSSSAVSTRGRSA